MHSTEVQEGEVMTELFLWVLSRHQALGVLSPQPTPRGACLQAETEQPEHGIWLGAMALPSFRHAEWLAQKARFGQTTFDKSSAL